VIDLKEKEIMKNEDRGFAHLIEKMRDIYDRKYLE
jgi:hypothetical protein